MKKSKILIAVCLVLSLLVCSAIPAFAFHTDYSGLAFDRSKVVMRYDTTYQCNAPSDTSFEFYSVLRTNMVHAPGYVVIWSQDRLNLVTDGTYTRLEGDGQYYFIYASSLDKVKDFLFSSVALGEKTLLLRSDLYFKFSEYEVIYSNRSYMDNGEVHSVNWPSAVHTNQVDFLADYLSATYTGLVNNGLTVFGTKISFFAMIAGPFVAAISLNLLNKLFHIGDGAVTTGVRIARNKSEKERRAKAKSERAAQKKGGS
jgi:hypothetical protein